MAEKAERIPCHAMQQHVRFHVAESCMADLGAKHPLLRWPADDSRNVQKICVEVERGVFVIFNRHFPTLAVRKCIA